MDEEDLEEMRALRASSRYSQAQSHIHTFRPARNRPTDTVTRSSGESTTALPTSSTSSSAKRGTSEGKTEPESMEAMMGFSGFGKKTAKHFNVEDMFEKAKRTAVELSSSRKKDPCEDDIEDDPAPFVIMPPVAMDRKTSDREKKEDSDDDDDRENDDDDQESLEGRIPVSHEISLDHGNKTVEFLA